MADNSHEISYLIFRKLGKISQNLLSAAVVSGALRVKPKNYSYLLSALTDHLILPPPCSLQTQLLPS